MLPCPMFKTLSLARFRLECKAAGKNLMVWTVNKPDHMMEVCRADRLECNAMVDVYLFHQAVRWEVNAIITDVTKTWLDLRTALQSK